MKRCLNIMKAIMNYDIRSKDNSGISLADSGSKAVIRTFLAYIKFT